ncbi:MAG: peroxiredoxin [Nannocystaceae bacterium]
MATSYRSAKTPAAAKPAKTATRAAAKPAAAKPTKTATKAAAKPAATRAAAKPAATKAATKPAAAKPAAAKPTATRAAAKPAATKAAAKPALPEVGAPAPDFRLAGDDGVTHALADLRGRRVVLYFYPRDNTPGCTTEACDFRDHHGRLRDAGAVIFGVSGDSLASHGRFRAKFELPFVLLSDPDNAIARAYGAYGPKKMGGRNFEGILRSTFVIGPDGRLEAVYSPVKVAGHAAAVTAAIEARR